MEKIGRWLILIKFFLIYKKYQSKLPTKSNMIDPKMHYDVFSDGVFWEDEELEYYPELVGLFRSVLCYRTYLIVNQKEEKLSKDLKGHRKFFRIAQKKFPNWIGFQEKRCSYNPELADRIRRIRKVSEWKMEKFFNEEF